MMAITLAAFLFLFPHKAAAIPGDHSPDGVWTQTDRTIVKQSFTQAPTQYPREYSLFALNPKALDGILAGAPMEFTKGLSDAVLTLPMPDGSFARFKVYESPILSDVIQAGYPDIKTYAGQGIDDPAATVRFDVTMYGFRAMILSSTGSVFIDPFEMGKTEFVMSYWKRDFPSDDTPFECGTTAVLGDVKYVPSVKALSGDMLHTYRMVVTATGEYTQHFGGVAAAVAQITTTMNRVNQVYERDVAVRFNITRTIVFTDPVTDPFSNGTKVDGTLLNENQSTVDDSVGSGNYDIGHILSQGGDGGFAPGDVCQSSKAKGGTSRNDPTGDPFDIDYVAHEVGHQMGGSHTFNGTTGSCSGGTRTASSAYEPGSGSTIMAYAGICGDQDNEDVQPNSDPYFHVRSLSQIISTRDGSGDCAVKTATGNTPPTANAQTDWTIPRETPFKLTGVGTDPDGDALTYCWEQYDLGDASPPWNTSNGPLFRSLNPATSPSRTFPNLTDLLAGTPSVWERLPTVDRDMKFQFTVRDNNAGGGGVDWDDMTVTVVGDPFYVTYPNGGQTFQSGCPITVTWVVGGGDIVPTVNIWLSTDGGLTLSQLLANTANDGSHELTIPCVDAPNARIMIAAAGGIFFDYSDDDFRIENAGPAITSASFSGGSVDGSCQKLLSFSATIADDCSILAGDVDVSISIPGGNASFTPPTIIKTQTTGSSVSVTGEVLVYGLTSSPADVHLNISATDGCGNNNAAVYNSNVFDDTDPVITCPSDLTFECDAVGDFGFPTATDNCDSDPDITEIVHDSIPGACPQAYQLVLTYQAEDASGNTATCQQTITVEDTTDPVIACPDTLEFVFTSPTQAVIAFEATATDNCNDDPEIVCDSASGSQFGIGLHTITCRVDDGCGNMDSCAFSFRLVPLDVLPGRCPNPLNVKSTGIGSITSAGTGSPSGNVLPVAILGSADFDVRTIDVATLRLQGFEPLRTSYYDVSTPVADDPSQGCECADAQKDGYLDLLMKFDKQDIITSLGDVENADDVMLQLTGALGDGTPIAAGDCVLIRAEKEISTIGGITAASADNQFVASSYPNPFNAATTIKYRLVESAPVTLTVYNVLGQRVAELVNETQAAGEHSVTWYGTDASGREAASGMYFYRLQAGTSWLTRKIMLLK